MCLWKWPSVFFLVLVLTSLGRAGAETPPEWRDRPEPAVIHLHQSWPPLLTDEGGQPRK